MAYATVSDVQARMSTTMTADQQNICANLLNDAAVIIDAYNSDAATDAKNVVSIRMVCRAMNSGNDIPIGATQGSMSALGYSQSWTLGTNASVGELYLNRLEKKLLGAGNAIGASNPMYFLVSSDDSEEDE